MRISDWSSDVCSSDLHPGGRTPCGSGLLRRTGPGATTHDPRAAARVHPGLAVFGRTPVAVMPAVGDPLADIACEVVKAICIGGEAGDRCGPPQALGVGGEGVVPTPAAGRLVDRKSGGGGK